MKKGDRVKIKQDARYDGQDMSWTETPTHKVALKKGDKVYHTSDRKLTSFLPVETCFHSDGLDGCTGHAYLGILQEDVEVQGYSNDGEVRIDLSETEIDMYYLGTTEIVQTGKRICICGGWQPEYRWVNRTISI